MKVKKMFLKLQGSLHITSLSLPLFSEDTNKALPVDSFILKREWRQEGSTLLP